MITDGIDHLSTMICLFYNASRLGDVTWVNSTLFETRIPSIMLFEFSIGQIVLGHPENPYIFSPHVE